MKNGQSVEVDIQPMDVSIVTSPEPSSGGPMLMGREMAGWWLDSKGAARNSCGKLNITIEGKSR